MNLYELTRVDLSEGDYDVCNGGIVAAENEQKARVLMSTIAWYEGGELWLDGRRSTCDILSADTERVIITNCNAG
jgi:hypothetical protein